jgi:hypothetical protein
VLVQLHVQLLAMPMITLRTSPGFLFGARRGQAYSSKPPTT